MIVGRKQDGSLFQVVGGSVEQEVELIKDQQQAKVALAEIGVQATGPVFVSIEGGLEQTA